MKFKNQISNDIKLTSNSQIDGLVNPEKNVDIVDKPKGGIDGVQSSTTHEANLENKFQSKKNNKNIENNRDVNSFTAHKANLENDYQNKGAKAGASSGFGASQMLASRANRRTLGTSQKNLGAGTVGGKPSLNTQGAKANVRVDNPDLAVGGFHKNAIFNPTLFNDDEQIEDNNDLEEDTPQESENTKDGDGSQESNANNTDVNVPAQSDDDNNDNKGIKGKVGKVAKFIAKIYLKKYVIIGIVAGFVVFLLFLLLGGEAEAEGDMDGACNYNETTVTVTNCYQSDSDKQVLDTLSIEDYVIGATYAYTKGETYSNDAIKALMIAIKTSALSYGNYNSSSKNVEVKSCSQEINYCNVTDGCQSEDYEIQLEAASSTYSSKLQSLYSDISNYVYVSVSYTSAITNLSTVNVLSINDSTLSEFESLASSGSSYTDILASVYNVEGEEEEEPEQSENVSSATTSNTLIVGDSRTNGLRLYVDDLNDDNTVYAGGMGYAWFANNKTASQNTNAPTGGINGVNSKITGNTSYNIVLWLGINDMPKMDDENYESIPAKYVNKYIELATGDWSSHTLYVLPVGPVVEGKNSYTHLTKANVDRYNSILKSLVENANLPNLKYLDIDLSFLDASVDGVHYWNKSDNEKLYSLIMSSIGNGGYISSKKQLYNLTDYCAYLDTTGLDNDLFWWPVGSKETTTTNGVTFASGSPALATNPTNDSLFGPRALNGGNMHYGIDIGAGGQIGVYNVIATKSGTVIKVNNSCADNGTLQNNCGGQRGNYVYIDHGDGIITISQHMALNSITVKVGDYVEQGQVIGKIGMSGRCQGAHLHFEVHLNDVPVDPMDYVNAENPRPVSLKASGSYSFSGNSDAETVKKEVCESLQQKYGMSKLQTTIIMMNMLAESTFDPAAVNSYSGAYGLCQWLDRKDKLQNQVYCTGGSCPKYTTVEGQLMFLMYELNGSESAAYKKLTSATSVTKGVQDFCNSYERPGKSTCAARAARTSDINSLTSYVNNGCK